MLSTDDSIIKVKEPNTIKILKTLYIILPIINMKRNKINILNFLAFI